MRYILIIILFLNCLTSQAQTERNFGIIEVFRGGDSLFIKKLVTQVVNISDGTVTKMRTPPDTAKLFISNDGFIYEGVITWRKVGGVVTPPVIQKVDGESATFTGNWARTPNNPTWYLGTIAYSNTAGATASYTFNGTKVEIWAERLASHGTGTIKIDTGAEVAVSFNTTPFGLPVKIFESATLPLGNHTITLKCVSGYVLLDYFSIVK